VKAEPRDRTVGDLLAVDPGLRSPGVALFRAGRLIAAKKLKGDTATRDDEGARWLRVAQTIVAWAVTVKAQPRSLMFERPQFYGVGKSKVDPNKLAGLIGVSANVSGLLAMAMGAVDVGLEVVTAEPDEWTMGTSKTDAEDPFETSRGRAVMSRLFETEAGLVPASHDAIDAVGLGLFALGRFAPRRVYPGAV
jgi:hypothetical protein